MLSKEKCRQHLQPLDKIIFAMCNASQSCRLISLFSVSWELASLEGEPFIQLLKNGRSNYVARLDLRDETSATKRCH